MLQQQQQQQQQQLPLPNSASFSSVSSATATPLVTALNQACQSNSANPNTTNGNSSPALKSLIRNLRGSLKYPQGTNIDISSTSRQSTTQQIYENNDKLIETTPTSTFSSAPKLNRANSNSTFKSSQPINEIKNDYSNCISQLQSAAAQAISSTLHQQNSYMNGNNLSPSEMGTHFADSNMIHSAPAPVLFRNNKFNQSLNSNHSHTNTNQQQLNNLLLKLNETSSTVNNQTQDHQQVLSTFKDASQSIVNNPVIDTRKCKFSFIIIIII
jgi:hypothetical protein